MEKLNKNFGKKWKMRKLENRWKKCKSEIETLGKDWKMHEKVGNFENFCNSKHEKQECSVMELIKHANNISTEGFVSNKFF